MELLAIASLSFLVGSIPWAFLAGRLRGIDIRMKGSGNVGATNAARSLGALIGAAVALLDAGKGLASVLLIAPIGTGAAASIGVPGLEAITAGAAAMLGHVFCPWLAWKGGKGVAVGAAVAFAMAPLAAAISLGVFLAFALATRYVSVGSLGAALALPLSYLFLYPGAVSYGPTLAFFCAAFAFILLTHRKNIIRLAEGKEPRF
jgi:glycerol-3-phosphate acyltransferase PlsY